MAAGDEELLDLECRGQRRNGGVGLARNGTGSTVSSRVMYWRALTRCIHPSPKTTPHLVETGIRAESKKIWATRGKDARVAAAAARLAQPASWRQLSGIPLMIHEVKHVGNRPFMVGFAVCAVGALWIQTKFTDEMREGSLYWSTFHGDGKKGGH